HPFAQAVQDLLRGDADQPRGGEGQDRRADGGGDEQCDGADERGEVAVDGRGDALSEGVSDEYRYAAEEDGGGGDDDGEEDDLAPVRSDRGHEPCTGRGRCLRWQLFDLVVAVESDGTHARPPSCAWASAMALAPMSSR